MPLSSSSLAAALSKAHLSSVPSLCYCRANTPGDYEKGNRLKTFDLSQIRYLLHYSQVPSEKQLKSLFSRLESSRLIGPKKTTAPAAKMPKISPKKTSAPASKTPKKIATAPIKKNAEPKPSVRTPIEGKRKRKIVQESDDSEESDEFEESKKPEKKEGTEAEGSEDEEYEEEEILGEQEDDFAKRIIEEESEEIYL